MGEFRNLILAVALAAGIFILWQVFVLEPALERQQGEAPAEQAEQPLEPGADAPAPREEPGIGGPASGADLTTREAALARSERVAIRTPAVEGSIALTGARFDDLRLLRYDTEIDSGEPVTLLNPSGGPGGHYAVSGWAGGSGAPEGLPGAGTEWRLVQGDALTPESPVVLEHRAGDLVFTRTISVDENYLFTVRDAVTNEGGAAVSLSRYGLVRQEDLPAELANFYILHEGPIGVAGREMFDRKFEKLADNGPVEREGEGGWTGITSKYWLAAVAPSGSPQIRAQFRTLQRGGRTVYESNYIRDPETIGPGQTLESEAYVFAGAKNQTLLSRYEQETGIPRLTMAIDWGMFWFLTRPFFAILHAFDGWIGNFGVAIMILVVGLKLVLFPLNNRAFASMAKMRAVQPKMQELRERYADDQQRLQQEMMDMYRREKINPVAGCLPILPQIPIFFALYKTVFISLDARHAGFLWIRDMSAPDPTSMWNLFGILPYDPAGLPVIGGVLAIGLFPLIMGVTMWAQQALNPPPPDPMQRRIFAFLPVVFTIVLAGFPAALVIYWAWNNFLTIVQQYIIMRRHGTETELDKRVQRLRARLTGAPAPQSLNAPDAPASDTVIEGTAREASAEQTESGDEGETATESGDAAETTVEPEAEPTEKPAGGARTRSNPAAKKKRGGATKKPAAKRKPAPRKKPTPKPGDGDEA
ncbi:membrane protein insertase YidC [Marinicauda salina]|uniref:Membrane protein insertase YidC n=1 Tax=Marinicauda salina TaxID=2135793 RepID=A0A2U2BXR7_9PROT|nr:membrane protein insertase YidC [Marinicauda salina]PWE18802.1 membrane protein insertase YidC [Marinicauda salina]